MSCVHGLIRGDGRNNHVRAGREGRGELHQIGSGFLRPSLDLFAHAGRVHVNIEGNGTLHARFTQTLGEVKGRFAESHESQPLDS